jgi:acetyltransferase-like isoleucine patch superfamily enzyme
MSGKSRKSNNPVMIEFIWEKLLRLRARMYTLALSSGFYSFGKGSVVVPPLRFHALHGIQIGNSVLVHSHCWIQALPNSVHAPDPLIVIKDNAIIGMNATISAIQQITIEEYVLLGRNVYISDHGHEYHDIAKPIAMQGIRKVAAVRIGAESWIGQNAVILPGASIGKHCVIGANSVVNSAIPDDSVAAGAPAKVIKQYSSATATWDSVLPHG